MKQVDMILNINFEPIQFIHVLITRLIIGGEDGRRQEILNQCNSFWNVSS